MGRKKFFVKIFQTNYVYIRSPQGVLITKNTKEHKIIKNCKSRKNDPQGGTLGPPKANFSTIEFLAELAMLVIYILVVYEEYIIKSSNFNIRKNSRARGDHWVLGGSFFAPLKNYP